MSFGIQVQSAVVLTEMALVSAEAEEVFQPESLDSDLPDKPGELNTASKQYTFLPLHTNFQAKNITAFMQLLDPKALPKALASEKPSPMQMASSSLRPSAQVKSESQSMALPQKHVGSIAEKAEASSSPRPNSGKVLQTPTVKPNPTFSKTPNEAVRVNTKASAQERTTDTNRNVTALKLHQWSKEETKQWWETRYHQREREGGNQKGQDQEQNPEKEEEKICISKTASMSSKKPSSCPDSMEATNSKAKKPELPAPSVGVFALYYLLTKMGIYSDGVSNFSYKKEIEYIDTETTQTHKKRLEEIKEGIKKEKETARWGVAMKVFSWIASLLGIISGIALIATGVGVVAGAMLIAGGTIQITNQILEVSGGWQKIAEMLPGDDTEKKRAVISWMQIGIAVLCLILSGAGVIWGGYANFGEAMQTAMGAIGGIASMGYGVTTIGEGIADFLYKDKLAAIKKFDIRLAQLKHMRQDLMEKVDCGMDRLEQLFEDLSHALEFEEELFQADQMLYRR